MAVSDITAGAVQAALDEFNELGREAFLARYKMGPARGHYLVQNGKKYDAKAIVAAAHARLPDKGLLTADDFHGGEASTRPLRRLGFKTVGPADAVTGVIPFERGQLYHRQTDIHQQFGGQERGGIATPDDVPLVFIFTGETGARYGYEDKWIDDGTFEYTGEGKKGPMEFVRGNRAIRDHSVDGKDILLFEADKKKGLYRYMGSFGCSEL
jgi:5-methylcytosine-specific restriction protein A